MRVAYAVLDPYTLGLTIEVLDENTGEAGNRLCMPAGWPRWLAFKWCDEQRISAERDPLPMLKALAAKRDRMQAARALPPAEPSP